MLLSRSLSWENVRSRYSVSRTAVESSKFFVSSATDASFCAMATPCVYETLRDGEAPGRSIRCSRLGKTEELRRKRTELDSRSGMSFRTPAQAPVLTELRSGALSRTPMTGGLWLVFQHTPPPHLPPNPPPSPTETTCSRRTHTSSMPR